MISSFRKVNFVSLRWMFRIQTEVKQQYQSIPFRCCSVLCTPLYFFPLDPGIKWFLQYGDGTRLYHQREFHARDTFPVKVNRVHFTAGRRGVHFTAGVHNTANTEFLPPYLHGDSDLLHVKTTCTRHLILWKNGI